VSMTALCEEYLRVMGVDGGRLLAAKVPLPCPGNVKGGY
jgi:hypothetical protein